AKEAVITAKEILSKSPGQWSAQLLLGHAKFAQGERLEALEAYSRALKAEPSLATDIRLGEYLDEAFLYECCRKQAATLLIQLCGKRGIARVVDKASSPLAPIETRKVSREALIAAGKQDEIDWLASLTADLEQAKGCTERAAVIEAIVARGDSRFVPVLEAKLPQRGRARGFFRRQSGNPFYCVRRELQDAIEALTPGEGGASR
ncbi:MAG: hypothetical protein MUC50_03390, partial [Myxococcota bacterium]|nr:hypothetical protein [Myxococcota bacterium]